METPERLESCPPTPEEVIDGASVYLEEALVSKLKLLESNICVICYSSIKNGQKAFPSCCSHIFCFGCLCKWSKHKNQCPLCKQTFDIIIHNVKSKTEYDRYQVVVHPRGPSDSPINLSDIVFPMVPDANSAELNSVYHRVNFLTNHSPRRRFTYRTRFEATLEQNERIQELFGGRSESDYSRLTPAEWRRYVYDRNMFALPLPDISGRHRECRADFYRENPAQTHRLIPWLNRELVVLMPPTSTNAIPQILEEMRNNLCIYDIQSREIRDYFMRYLHDKTDHFIHEFYNFAISAYDIVGYDRNVDYSPRTQTAVATVEISSNESSDGEVQVIEGSDTSAGSTGTDVIRMTPDVTTEVVMETTGTQEESFSINDMANEIAENVPPAESEVVVESSGSECQFVLALKPPHLRTPEQVSLDSASDSDVVYIPDDSQPNAVLSSSDTEDNKPLSETKKKLKSEINVEQIEEKIEFKNDGLIMSNFTDALHIFNYGASGSTASQPDDHVTNQKKFYFSPIRKRLSKRSVLESTSSESLSSDSENSDEEWQSKLKRCSKNRRKSKKFKKRRVSSTIVSNQKPLSQLPTSEEAPDDEAIDKEYPRIKSVIIKKFDDQQHYIEKQSTNSDLSSE